MIISKEEVEKAAHDNTESMMFSHNSMETRVMANRLDKVFIAGVEFSEEYIQQHVQDIIIENQGLKLYKDNEEKRFKELAVEFAEWIIDGCYKCPFKTGVDAYVWYYNDGNYAAKSTEELYEIFKKEK